MPSYLLGIGISGIVLELLVYGMLIYQQWQGFFYYINKKKQRVQLE